MCLRDTIINAAPIIVVKIDILESCQQCPPKRVKDTHKKELWKFEFVLSVMTNTPIMKIETEKMVVIRILLVIGDGVYVCICMVY